ncbi:YitT family protein [Lactococcus allomyrinae]|uniref:YitT family protein n=1 Tax=Lactococcus allomyrinae TaxID=2419773 RepID=A0A387BIY9_9LACT|nr:YitT family protein [Lactococcus allomyrinae]AYG00997.1 YitT family protein [Lactococcus allomyrinae]
MKNLARVHFLHIVAIALGTAIYAFGFVEFNMANHLAEGGVAGLSLIGHALFHIDPSYTQLILNIPLLIVGYRFLGRRTFIYTIWGILSLSIWMWIFQRVDFSVNVGHDNLIAALLAGVFAGIGIGFVFRFGGTTGGADIVAKLLQIKRGVAVGKTFFAFDACVMLLSLSYINLNHMMYTLIASFVAAQVLNVVQSGGYTVRGMLIITSKHREMAKEIIEETGRGATYLHGEGAYSGHSKEILYVVLNPGEIQEVKQILSIIDPNAFTSIINVHEVIGDFTYPRSRFKEVKKINKK